ncbi:MAG: sialate O-acetylesterase [Planctomycetota bacterium]
MKLITFIARAIVVAVVAISVTGNAAVAQQSGEGKPQEKFKGPIKVFILAGQSNMEGHAGVQTLDRLGEHPTHGYLLKQIKNDDGSFVVRDDVLVSYQKADERIKRPLSVGMGAWGADWFGPELMFGIGMGDHFTEPVLLIKTCWGGHSLYGNFRPPSAGKPAYETDCKPEEMGASYHKMVKEVRECLATLDTDFPQLKGLKPELCGFVWFQGWNDMCQPGDKIRQQVYDEYCPNFVHLVQDLRSEFKVPSLPVVMGELGVGGEQADKNMADFRTAQAKIATCPELKGTLGYVRTAPFWYPELDALPREMESQESRVRKAAEVKVKEHHKGQPQSADPKKMEQLVREAGDKALKDDAAYQQAKKDSDRHVCNWYCHYQGSARVYCMVGYSLAEAMKPLLRKEPHSNESLP